jgi:transposase
METLMGVKDARRLGVVEAALRGKITNGEGAEALGLSPRQFRRLKRRVERAGARGVLHGNRGRPSPRRLDERIRRRVEALLQGEVRLNDCHLRDLLGEEGVAISAESVRRIRRRLGLPAKQRRRPSRHRRRRERAARRGALVLIDGSPFRWLGLEGPELTLIGTLDDATGEILALTLRAEEDLHGFTQALHQTLTAHGLPLALYGDGTSIAVRNDPHWTLEEELEGRQRPSHFGLMLEELGIRYIRARSPQAKGRIERLWRTLQDRLAAELALHGITTLAAALAFLPGFIARFNRQLARAPREPLGVWRPAPRRLDHILACRYPRVVARDNTVSIPGCVLQLPPGPHHASHHGRTVEVRELLDGRRLVLHQGRVLLEQPAPPGPFTLAPRASARSRRRSDRETDFPRSPRIASEHAARLQSQTSVPRFVRPRPRSRPAATHPWKKPYKPQPRASAADRGGTESLRS